MTSTHTSTEQINHTTAMIIPFGTKNANTTKEPTAKEKISILQIMN